VVPSVTNPLPNETPADHCHLAARALISSVPAVGGTALELFKLLLAPPIQRRRDAWLNELGDRLSKLEQEGLIKLEDLSANEEFISTVIQASTIAIRNHEKEKMEALRNAVFNVALHGSPEEWKREWFLTLIDVFSVLHLQVLMMLAKAEETSPGRVPVKTAIEEIAARAEQLVPALSGQRKVAEVIIGDLCGKGLLFWNEVYIPSGAKQVSELGREFLRLLTEPSASGESAG